MYFIKLALTYMLIMGGYTILLSACSESSNPTPDTETPSPQVQANGNPGLTIISPDSDFVVGEALGAGLAPSAQTVSVIGWVRVEDNNGIDNSPSVMVNQQVATVIPHAFATNCPSSEPFHCFQFEANLNVNKGVHTVSIKATDSNGKASTKSIAGIVDYCRKGAADPGVAALFQTDPNASVMQNNRCHEIDGCSVYITENDPLASSDTRNDPMAGANHYRLDGSSTAFGKGEAPPLEYFVHGQDSAYSLPCNAHDVCYQTINGMTRQQCDDQMSADMETVCAQAYPSECPGHLKSELGACELWNIEKSACYTFTTIYYEGLRAVGSAAFNDRQTEYRF